ncbi:penicillin-binding transpeptidase domain-containing protein [Gaoshiqia sediminis]|uniref:Penicillin-binding transpeptidase domain-containing protein n=1 Tax=Gaoshiqia sediminis TaxID=2986998 RepID=A0AA41Y7W4_9BACT|nr:penicillin-binding transpeptidase domain-containing protein [Gaoshiqia sediminis]MCW0482518.1 penicillin-binding transpeptidase domain-containing protein [Gaoshiqia sediminis]
MEIRKDITFRFGIIYFLAILMGVIILVKIFMIQTVDTGKWEQIAKELKTNTTELQAKRGNVCADDGSILATSVPYYELRLDLAAPRVKRVFDEHADEFSLQVAELFNISKSQFKQKLTKAYRDGNRWFLVYPQKVNYNQLQQFKRLGMMKRGYFGSGLIVVGESERVMPHGDMASRTIGTLNKGAYGGIHGNVGYSGIEGIMESYLAGENGLALKRNYSGHWVDIPIVEPKDGKDVVTTINVNLQDFTQNALMRQMLESQAEWGTAVVMEVKTGEIKAIANLGRRKDGAYAETYNFALGHAGCSEPGSTFKLMSMMVAMEHGYVDTSDVFDTGVGKWEYRGQTIYDSDYGHGGHGKISMKKIFELSSNVGVAKIITKYYEGKERDFIDRIYNFGLNKPLGLGFAGEGVPYIKYPGDQVWWGPSLAWISYGYEIKLTPLQTLTFYNAIANNGRMVKPKFVKEVQENGLLVKEFKTEVINPAICSRETLAKARLLLEGVCAQGTGKSLNNPYFPIAGKTGTAQVAYQNEGYTKGGRKNYQASFAGYFPADDPKYSVIVVIVGPKGKFYGGSVAGPVFKEVVGKVYASFLEPRNEMDEELIKVPEVKTAFRNDIAEAVDELDLDINTKAADGELIQVKATDEKIEVAGLNVQEGSVPNVIGMGGSDALFLLEKSGLKVKMNGLGKVRKQSVPAGNKVKKGQTIYLELS